MSGAVARLIGRTSRGLVNDQPPYLGEMTTQSDATYGLGVPIGNGRVGLRDGKLLENQTPASPTPRSRAIRRTPTPLFRALRIAATFLASVSSRRRRPSWPPWAASLSFDRCAACPR